VPTGRLARPAEFRPIVRIAGTLLVVTLLFRLAVIQLAPPESTVMARLPALVVTCHCSDVGTVPPI